MRKKNNFLNCTSAVASTGYWDDVYIPIILAVVFGLYLYLRYRHNKSKKAVSQGTFIAILLLTITGVLYLGYRVYADVYVTTPNFC